MVRVRSVKKAEAIVALCQEHGWQVIAGIEEDEPEAADKPHAPPRIGGNDYCPCRSGKKFKNCCGAAGSPL